MPAGRPTDYNDEIIIKSKQYLDLAKDEVKQVVSGESDKFTAYKEKLIVNLPTIEGLAVHLEVSRDTMYEWEKVHPEFSYILNVLRGLQSRELINKGLSGDYNPIIAKLLLMKHGYAEKTESDNNFKGGISISWKEPPVRSGSGEGPNGDLPGN